MTTNLYRETRQAQIDQFREGKNSLRLAGERAYDFVCQRVICSADDITVGIEADSEVTAFFDHLVLYHATVSSIRCA